MAEGVLELEGLEEVVMEDMEAELVGSTQERDRKLQKEVREQALFLEAQEHL